MMLTRELPLIIESFTIHVCDQAASDFGVGENSRK